MNQYENRVVLFLDILGFKSKIKSTLNKEGKEISSKIDVIKKLILGMKNNFNHPIRGYSKTRQITQFSDSIIVSFRVEEENEIYYLLSGIQQLIIQFVNHEFLCRGAISYGKLIHNRQMVFGPAFIEAYETETKAALYPRVILDKSIIEIVFQQKNDKIFKLFDDTKYSTDSLINHFLNQDTDEKYYIDYFINPFMDRNHYSDIINYNENLRKIIISGLNFEEPDLKVKYGWMKNKYNTLVNYINEKNRCNKLNINLIVNEKVTNKIVYIE